MPGSLDVAPGRANERTALAWQRTALSLLAGCAAMARITWTALGPVALALAGVAAVLALWVFLESRGRYRHAAGITMRDHDRGGRAPLFLAVATVVLAVMELTALVGH